MIEYHPKHGFGASFVDDDADAFWGHESTFSNEASLIEYLESI